MKLSWDGGKGMRKKPQTNQKQQEGAPVSAENPSVLIQTTLGEIIPVCDLPMVKVLGASAFVFLSLSIFED